MFQLLLIYGVEKMNIYGMYYPILISRYLNSTHFMSETELIRNFIRKRSAEGISESRLYKYLKVLKSWKHDFFEKRKFSDLSREEIEEGVAKLTSSKYSPHTKISYRAILKVLFKTMFPDEEGQEPKLTRWIKARAKTDSSIPAHLLLKPDDIQRMADAIDQMEFKDHVEEWFRPQMKAAIHLHFESIARVGETLGMKIRDIQIEEENGVKHAVLYLNGKTGGRPMYVVDSAPLLENWLMKHPFTDEMDSPLWLNQKFKPMRYNAFRLMIHKAAKIAGIGKPTNTHFFRKSAASWYGKHHSEFIVSKMGGWKIGSPTLRTYIHMGRDDVKEAILKKHLKTSHP